VAEVVRPAVEPRVPAARELHGTRLRDLWMPRHARPCTTDDIEFHSLKLTQHLCNMTCRPLTLMPSDRGPMGRTRGLTHGVRLPRGLDPHDELPHAPLSPLSALGERWHVPCGLWVRYRLIH
jgi:hypothetical protein